MLVADNDFKLFVFEMYLKCSTTPEKLPSQKENSLPTVHFQGLCYTSGGVVLPKHVNVETKSAGQGDSRNPPNKRPPVPPMSGTLSPFQNGEIPNR